MSRSVTADFQEMEPACLKAVGNRAREALGAYGDGCCLAGHAPSGAHVLVLQTGQRAGVLTRDECRNCPAQMKGRLGSGYS